MSAAGMSDMRSATYATIELTIDDPPPARVGMSGSQGAVDAAPEGGLLGPDARTTAIVDPICRTTLVQANPDLVGLMLHHPGLGWLSFALPRAEAQKLGESLVALANTPPDLPDAK
jgi:hypothetical protein